MVGSTFGALYDQRVVTIICKECFRYETGWCADSRDVGHFPAHPFFKLDDAVGDEAHSENIEP
jgi:hypothetical protein